MSFFINNNNTNRPGPICGNVTNGLCEKTLIETNKVFDACLTQTTETGLVITTADYSPADPATPLTYVSAESSTTTPATITDVVITRLTDKPNFANVTGTVTIPLIVTYRDANGVTGTATSTITYPVNTTLYVPQPSLNPVTIEVSALFRSSIGTYTAENTFTITGCLQIIVKVVSEVLLLIPSYGYPIIPPCQVCENAICPNIFDQPIFPTSLRPNQINSIISNNLNNN
ncbi:MAG: hypothetical protein E7378_00785 [Clostridiales bacterium]|nr:hypothetical protein [Clostridiales bacterium]